MNYQEESPCSHITCCVFMSTPESQHPKPGWLWYHPTTISGLRDKILVNVERGGVAELVLICVLGCSQWGKGAVW
eukprot:1162114-Pelagomonas_calceolata.AAC.2